MIANLQLLTRCSIKYFNILELITLVSTLGYCNFIMYVAVLGCRSLRCKSGLGLATHRITQRWASSALNRIGDKSCKVLMYATLVFKIH